MLVAIVALLVAVGGTAVAGGFLTKKKVKKVANNLISEREATLFVGRARTADVAISADAAKNVLFARVDYRNPFPVVTSGTPGVFGDGEVFEGAPILRFPRDVSNCAVTATAVVGAIKAVVRQQRDYSGGNTVVLIISTSDGEMRTDFNVVVVCP
jgi:hypothetical protein